MSAYEFLTFCELHSSDQCALALSPEMQRPGGQGLLMADRYPLSTKEEAGFFTECMNCRLFAKYQSLPIFPYPKTHAQRTIVSIFKQEVADLLPLLSLWLASSFVDVIKHRRNKPWADKFSLAILRLCLLALSLCKTKTLV